MRKMIKQIMTGAFVFLMASAAVAQDEPALEKKDTSVLKKLSYVQDQSLTVYFDNKFYGFNNGDLRKTDESSLDSVERTDDAFSVMSTFLGFQYDVLLKHGLRFYADAYAQGYWGGDDLQFSQTNHFYIKYLFLDIPLMDNSIGELVLGMGRQRYSFNSGYTGDYNSFVKMQKNDVDFDHDTNVMNDTIDAFVLHYNNKSLGFGADFIFDFYAQNTPVDSIYTLSGGYEDSKQYTVPFYGGDVNTYRVSLVPFYQKKTDSDVLKYFSIKPYMMFARFGAVGDGSANSGGQEQTNNGATGNFADGDWLMLIGCVAGIDLLDSLSLYVEVAYSTGKDFKDTTTPDVTINGFMGSVSATYGITDWLKGIASFMYATGSQTNSNGDYTNYGYVSFKGNKVGGFLFSQYYGSYGSGVADYTGIQFNPAADQREAAMSAAHIGVAIDELGFSTMKKVRAGFSAAFDAWMYFDTNTTGADFDDAGLPAYALEQQRFSAEGEFPFVYMGMELNLSASYKFFDGLLEVGGIGGVFIPADYYTYAANDEEAPAGDALFWGVQLYSSLKF